MGGITTLGRLITADLLALAGILAFVLPLSRRRHYAARLGLGSAVFLLGGFLFWKLRMGGRGGAPGFWGGTALLFVLVLGLVLLVSDQTLKGALYVTVWALSVQQFLLQQAGMLYRSLGEPGPVALVLALELAAVYWFLARAMPENGFYPVGPRQTLSALALYLVFAALMELTVRMERQGGAIQGEIIVLMCEFYCMMVLYLQNALFKKSAISQELAAMNLLWHQQKEQYDLAKESIALINQKCHDLKHQVRALRGIDDSRERARYLDEIDDSIRIYEAIVKTGCDALDTILTEKSLLCKEKNIRVDCVADGSRMGFIDPVDLYTVFGNALDNAIEEVQKFDDPEKRQIDVLVHVQQQFLVINVSNPLYTRPRFEDELPVTTKGNNGYHGFGLKSVRHTVRKYGGFLTIGTEQGCFSLKILFPLPEQR